MGLCLDDAIVVFVDKLTKMTHLAATTTTVNAEGFANIFVDHVFRTHGLPKKIVLKILTEMPDLRDIS